MAEYIDKVKLEQAMYQKAFIEDSDLTKWDGGCWIRYKLFENVLEKTETADVQPVVHGKWVNDIQCSNCGWYMEDDVTISPMMVFFDYCPHCGAKMDGE